MARFKRPYNRNVIYIGVDEHNQLKIRAIGHEWFEISIVTLQHLEVQPMKLEKEYDSRPKDEPS